MPDEKVDQLGNQLDLAWSKVQEGLRNEKEGQRIIEEGQQTVERGQRIVRQGREQITIGQELKAKGRDEWLQGTLDLMHTLSEGKKPFGNNRVDFGKWLIEHGYGPNHLTADERAAIMAMSKNMELARKVLERTTRRSWHSIYQLEFIPINRFHKAELAKQQYAEGEVLHTTEGQYVEGGDHQLPTNNDAALFLYINAQKSITTEEEEPTTMEVDDGKIFNGQLIPPEPIGLMPDDIQAKYAEVIREIKIRLERLYQLGRYRDQMSAQLQHFVAAEINIVSSKAERLARDMLGGERDLRKIVKPYCDEVIPLRTEDDRKQQIELFKATAVHGDLYCKVCKSAHGDWSEHEFQDWPGAGLIIECNKCGNQAALGRVLPRPKNGNSCAIK